MRGRCLSWVKRRPAALKYDFCFTPESGLKSDIACQYRKFGQNRLKPRTSGSRTCIAPATPQAAGAQPMEVRRGACVVGPTACQAFGTPP
jgi:hypothetical protein